MDQAGDQVRSGRRQEEQEVARPDLGHGLVLLPQARASPTSRSSSAGCSATTRTRASRPITIPKASSPSSATTTSSWDTAGSRRAVQAGRLAGPIVSIRRTGDDVRIDYVDPTPQRKGRPDDIAFRSMPAHAQSRYAAGLEKMSTYGNSRHVRREGQDRMVRLHGTSGTNSASTCSCRTTKFCATARWCRDKIRLDDIMHPERYKQMPENQLYWTQRWSDQMNYRYWKDAVRGRSDRQGRDGAGDVLRGDAGLQDR